MRFVCFGRVGPIPVGTKRSRNSSSRLRAPPFAVFFRVSRKCGSELEPNGLGDSASLPSLQAVSVAFCWPGHLPACSLSLSWSPSAINRYSFGLNISLGNHPMYPAVVISAVWSFTVLLAMRAYVTSIHRPGHRSLGCFHSCVRFHRANDPRWPAS